MNNLMFHVSAYSWGQAEAHPTKDDSTKICICSNMSI